MKDYRAMILILFFFLVCALSGCTTTSPPKVETHDSRLIGDWQETHTKEILTFKTDGTYTVTEAEMANWSTAPDGKLWMYGTAYSYALLENNTILTIKDTTSFTRTYHRL